MSTNGRPRAFASSRITASTSSMRSGLLHSSQPQASILAAMSRHWHDGLGSIQSRFKRLASCDPGKQFKRLRLGSHILRDSGRKTRAPQTTHCRDCRSITQSMFRQN